LLSQGHAPQLCFQLPHTSILSPSGSGAAHLVLTSGRAVCQTAINLAASAQGIDACLDFWKDFPVTHFNCGLSTLHVLPLLRLASNLRMSQHWQSQLQQAERVVSLALQLHEDVWVRQYDGAIVPECDDCACEIKYKRIGRLCVSCWWEQNKHLFPREASSIQLDPRLYQPLRLPPPPPSFSLPAPTLMMVQRVPPARKSRPRSAKAKVQPRASKRPASPSTIQHPPARRSCRFTALQPTSYADMDEEEEEEHSQAQAQFEQASFCTDESAFESEEDEPEDDEGSHESDFSEAVPSTKPAKTKKIAAPATKRRVAPTAAPKAPAARRPRSAAVASPPLCHAPLEEVVYFAESHREAPWKQDLVAKAEKWQWHLTPPDGEPEERDARTICPSPPSSAGGPPASSWLLSPHPRQPRTSSSRTKLHLSALRHSWARSNCPRPPQRSRLQNQPQRSRLHSPPLRKETMSLFVTRPFIR
jgi:hypothetical protein